ncbi:uncharacterized protein ACWYII_045928 isoform 3-T8 [Salvelinus alpinus]
MKATDEWANKTMKHGRYATLVNAANKLVGVYPLLLLSKRKKDNILSSTVLCPHSGMMNQTSMAAIQMLYEAIVKVAINTHTTTLQPSNPPPIAAQELSDTVAPQETSYTLILNQVEPPISPTIQETSYTPVLNQVEPLISPTTQETSYTPVLNQVEPPISPTTQETSYTPVLNQVEPLISPTTQETSYTPVLNQVEPPISPTTQETSYTPILNQVEPPISPTTQETSYTPILNQVEPPIFPTTQETSFTRIPNQVKPPITPTTQETSYTHTKPKKTGRKSCHLVTLKKPSKSMSMTVNSIPSNPIQPHPTPFYPIQPHPTPSYPIQPRPRKKKYDYRQKSVQCIRGKRFSLFSRFLPIELQRRVRSRR